MEKVLIFDFYKTIFNPQKDSLYRGMSVLLSKLREKYELVLITTQSKGRKKRIRKLGLDKSFKKIVICNSKSLKIFRAISQKTEEAIIIGDNKTEEISIAKKLGIPFTHL